MTNTQQPTSKKAVAMIPIKAMAIMGKLLPEECMVDRKIELPELVIGGRACESWIEQRLLTRSMRKRDEENAKKWVCLDFEYVQKASKERLPKSDLLTEMKLETRHK